MKLNAQTVNDTFEKCMFKEGEPTEEHVVGKGIQFNIGFHPERLKENTQLIKEMLNDLPSEFHRSGGGGMTFLNMCVHKEGNHWTGMHRTMDQLVALGNAIGKMKFNLPRELWQALPGGMPYVYIEELELT